MEGLGRWREKADHMNFIVKLSVEEHEPALKAELFEAMPLVKGDRSAVRGVYGQAHLPDSQFAASI